jgi:hypothetical protein
MTEEEMFGIIKAKEKECAQLKEQVVLLTAASSKSVVFQISKSEDPRNCKMEMGEASNRFYAYFDIENPEESEKYIREIKRLQDYAIATGAAPGPKPPKAVAAPTKGSTAADQPSG